jgi:hypothetical protein
MSVGRRIVRRDQMMIGLGITTLFAAGCSPDASSAPGIPAQIALVAGDAQLAAAGAELAQPLRFIVTDGKHHALAAVPVTFVSTIGDGIVEQQSGVTDANGAITERWQLGHDGGVQQLEARVAPGVTAIASATSCMPGECYPATQLQGELSAATLLSLATYDGSGQTVHPDVTHGHGAAHGLWLAITPYPGGNGAMENPSIFRSTNWIDWVVPTGVTNPLAPVNAFTGYNSDPDIVFNPSDQRLWLYYRSYTPTENTISVLRSSDGAHWDHAAQVIVVPAHQLVSPAIVRGAPQAPWIMWGVNAGPNGCSAATTTVDRRTSTDGLDWSAAAATDLVQPGQVIWHIDVQWIPALAEYWAIYNSYPAGGTCSTHSLYLAHSSDGSHWIVFPSPIARSGTTEPFSDVIYRATFLVDMKGTNITLWMSGARYTDGAGYTWHTAVASTTVAELLAIAAAPSTPTHIASRYLPPPEP